jgi:4a-hydroxytetrahydrobiopterin dehydratase
MTELTGQQITEQAPPGWVYLLGSLQTRIPTADFRAGLALVDAIGAAAEAMDHHPDLDLRYTHVDVRLTSHDVGRVTGRDLRLARTVSALAADAGTATGPAVVSRLELALDTPDRAAVLPFWAAVLGVPTPPEADGEVRDPAGVLPTVWFQESGPQEPRQHWHPDVYLDPTQVQPRLAAALAAGGTLVSDAAAPSFWVLADAHGNNVCLCTWQSPAAD